MLMPIAMIFPRKRSRVRRRDRRHGRCAPRLEALEGRALLSLLTVTSTGDNGPGTLRDTIAAAAAGDTVNFDPSLDGQVITLSGEITLPQNVSIEGPGSDKLTITAGGQSRIFEITDVGAQAAVSISGLTLSDGSAVRGGAIDDPHTDNTLTLSDCTFDGNQVTFEGGAIASNAPLSVDKCEFFANSAVNINGGTDPIVSYPASGGAIWAHGSDLTITNSKFFYNKTKGGDGALGGYAWGGAVDWEAGGGGDGVTDRTVVITGNKFVSNSVQGGSSNIAKLGGEAKGGAVLVNASYSTRLSVNISDNNFSEDSARGGDGLVGGLAEGGGFAFDGILPKTPTIVANNDQFESEGAFGGASTAGSVDTTGRGGQALGGAVAIVSDGANTPIVTFKKLTVTGSTAQGGGAGIAANGAPASAIGGDAQGGGVYLGAEADSNARFSITGGNLTSDKAIGGAGGSAFLSGLVGGDAAGGGLAMSAPVRVVTTTPTYTIDHVRIENCTATGGTGGAGIEGSVSNTRGGDGGTGGNAFGGGAVLNAGDSVGAIYLLTNDTFATDKAAGGHGGNAGNGAHGFNGGAGGFGGAAEGGGLAVVLGLNGFGSEGSAHAKGLHVNAFNCKFLVDQALGGNGGWGGVGLIGGIGGASGVGVGGGVALVGPAGDVSNQVIFDTDFLFANTAQAGTGGAGGQSIATKGGHGGAGRNAFGGGLSVVFVGTVCLKNSIILGNHAVGGQGGPGGLGVIMNGTPGATGVGIGGGVNNAGIVGSTVGRTADTLIITNVADTDPDIHGPMGNC
jgi:hypothetical protein